MDVKQTSAMNIRVDKDTYTDFRVKCQNNGVSIPVVIEMLMKKFNAGEVTMTLEIK